MKLSQSSKSNHATSSLFRWAAVVIGLGGAVSAGAASAESGYRVCAVEYEYSALGSVLRSPRITVSGRIGLVAKVRKEGRSTCDAKTNWMRNEFRRVGAPRIGAAGGLGGLAIDWGTASYGGPYTYSMWTCEGFFSHVQERNGDRCRAVFTATNNIYAYSARQRGAGGPLPVYRWYHS